MQGKRKWKQPPWTKEEWAPKKEEILAFFRKENVENYYWFFKQSGRRDGGFFMVVWITEALPVEKVMEFWHFGLDRRLMLSGKIVSMNSKIDEDNLIPERTDLKF